MTRFATATNPAEPIPATEGQTQILAATLLTTTFQDTSVVDVRDARKVVFLVDIDGAAADDQVVMKVLLSAKAAGEIPAIGDDVWMAPLVTDGSVTPTLLSGLTFHTGMTMTNVPEWGRVDLYPAFFKFPATDGATDEGRYAVAVECDWARWAVALFADEGAGSPLATVICNVVRVA